MCLDVGKRMIAQDMNGKNKSEFEQNGHHEIQADTNTSSLKNNSDLHFENQLDRDSTSWLKT